MTHTAQSTKDVTQAHELINQRIHEMEHDEHCQPLTSSEVASELAELKAIGAAISTFLAIH